MNTVSNADLVLNISRFCSSCADSFAAMDFLGNGCPFCQPSVSAVIFTADMTGRRFGQMKLLVSRA